MVVVISFVNIMEVLSIAIAKSEPEEPGALEVAFINSLQVAVLLQVDRELPLSGMSLTLTFIWP
jgi:hypothetical protein